MSSTVIHPIIDNLSQQDRNSRQSTSYEIVHSRPQSQGDFIIIDKDKRTATIQTSINLDSSNNDEKYSNICSMEFNSIKTTSQESVSIFTYSNKRSPKEEIIENPPTISIEVKETSENILTQPLLQRKELQESYIKAQALEKIYLELKSQLSCNNDLVKDKLQEVAKAYYKLGNRTIQYCIYQAGRHFINTALNYFKELNNEDYLAKCYDSLASLESSSADFASAAKYIQLSEELKLKLHGPNFPGLGINKFELAKINNILSKAAEEEEYAKEAIRLFSLDSKHYESLLISAESLLANVLVKRGELKEATDIHNKILGRLICQYGEGHSQVIKCYLNIASIQIKMKEFTSAKELLKRAYKLEEKSKDRSPLQLASINKKLGSICCRTGKYDEALVHYKISYQCRLKLYGENHPEVASALLQLSDAYMRLKRYDKARSQLESAIKIYSSYFGDTHTTLATCHHSLGNIYFMEKNYEAAKQCYYKCLAIDLAFYHEEHAELTETYRGLGEVFMKEGKFEEAKRNLEMSLKIKSKMLGSEHQEVKKIENMIRSIEEKLQQRGSQC